MPTYENYESFRQWLTTELTQRGWSHADLARRCGIARSHISRILGGERPPGADALIAIAHAMKLPEEELLRRGGKIALSPGDVEGKDELLHLFSEMTPANRRRLLAIARTLASEELAGG